LLGVPRPAFLADQDLQIDKGGWGPWGRDPAVRKRKLDEMLATFDRISGHLSAETDRFGVRYLALPAGASDRHLDGRWRKLMGGARWDLYRRDPASGDEGIKR
jgi:hypothetical protein